MTPSPRIDVIKLLASTALSAMEDIPIDDITVAEVVSASFTMAKNMAELLMTNSAPDELERNRQSLITAVAEIYTILQDGMIKH